MPRIATITNNKTSTRGVSQASTKPASKVHKTHQTTPEVWAMTGRWVGVTSSNVFAIMYDRIRSELHVRFKKKGGGGYASEYAYSGVRKDVAKNMYQAASMGKFVWRVLRDRYPYKRIS